MAEGWDLDFQCPQFIDFVAGLNNSGSEAVYFDCKDHTSPEDNEVISQSPSVSKPQKYLSEEENKLFDKMTAALSIIENTPKVKKPVRKRRLLTEKFSKNVCPAVAKSTIKPSTVPMSKMKLHRGKSIAQLNKIVTEKNKDGLRKRSSSLSDLRFLKKQKYPRTPICLKRTIVKAKSKIFKTTEELELEKIAELQKKLIQHLRYNEISLKRLGLKPRMRICTTRTKQENQGLDNIAEKKDVVEKRERRKLNMLNPTEIRNDAIKIENIFNQAASTESIADCGESSKSKPAITFPIRSSVKENVIKKSQNVRTVGFHSGLVFHPNMKKNTVVKPFSFDSKIKEAKTGPEKKAEVFDVPIKIDGKENISSVKALSTLKKSKEMQYVKWDKVTQSNKKNMEKGIVKPLKGLPLSENFARQ